MRKRLLRGFASAVLCAALSLAYGCGAEDKGSHTSTAAGAPTVAPIRHYRATKGQLHSMREKWDVSIMMLDTPAANVLGVMHQLEESPDESREYPILTDAPNRESAVSNLPRDWQAARSALQVAADVIGTARDDFQSWKDGADFDDALRSKFGQDKAEIIDSLCDALQKARKYYSAAGGYANDLSFVLLSDNGDRACQNVAMARPYTTTMKRRALATIAASTNETPEGNPEEAFLSDHTGFIIPAGTSVRVIGHRHYDSSEITLCQVRGGGGTGWVPCTWLSRAPRASDG